MVQVIAHRGAKSLAPENTLAAAELAFEIGADLWETDVQQTRDGCLVLYHDRTLERCTDIGSIFPDRTADPLQRFTYPELRMLDAGSFYSRTDPLGQICRGNVTPAQLLSYKGEKIPSVDQALAFTKKKQWRINLELKRYPGQESPDRLPEKTLSAIDASGLDARRVVISSFYHPWLERIQIRKPRIRVQALVGDDVTKSLDFGDFRFDTYNARADLITPAQVADLKHRGKTVNVFTVNDPEIFDSFRAMGVDGIFTDFPQRFVP